MIARLLEGVMATPDAAARDGALLSILAALAARPAAGPPWLARAVAGMEGAALREGVPALVRLCRRSHPHVARTVRADLGCTPQALVTRLRLDRARCLFASTDRTAEDVAEACGFADRSHLGRALRTAEGVGPRAHRARARRNPVRDPVA